MRKPLFALLIAIVPCASVAQSENKNPTQTSSFSLWETVFRVERYGPRDREPKVERRVEKRCLGPQERSGEAVMNREEAMKRLGAQCWVSAKRAEADRSQVKWACKDGSTAEIATRQPAPNRIGYQMVFNIPQQGALSITAESMQVADTCEPGPPPPAQPVPPTPQPPVK